MSRWRQTPTVVLPPSPTPRLTDLDPVDEEVFDPVVTPDNPTLTLEDPIVEAQVPFPVKIDSELSEINLFIYERIPMMGIYMSVVEYPLNISES